MNKLPLRMVSDAMQTAASISRGDTGIIGDDSERLVAERHLFSRKYSVRMGNFMDAVDRRSFFNKAFNAVNIIFTNDPKKLFSQEEAIDKLSSFEQNKKNMGALKAGTLKTPLHYSNFMNF